MTEEEALTKWCPFTGNRRGLLVWPKNTGRLMRCIASDCMAWRLFSPLNPNDGYCGLAGEPRRNFNHNHDDDDSSN